MQAPVSRSSSEGARSALIIAHPGHELRVHGWLESERPQVFVLTDGSGSSGRSRLASTRTILDRAGAVPGKLFGRLTDRFLYEAVFQGKDSLFFRLVEELADELDSAGVTTVVGDASEGYNPGHDVCRLLIDAAVALIHRNTMKPVANYAFSLFHRPDDCPESLRPRALRWELTPEAFARKLAAAQAYPELASEVEAALKKLGTEPFRIECLCPVSLLPTPQAPPDDPPMYERYGEKQVAAGKYREVLRYRAHLLPLERSLRQFVEREGS